MYYERVYILKKSNRILSSWGVLLIFLIIIAVTVYLLIRPVILANAISKAKNIITNAVNNSVIKVIKENEVSYSDIAVVSRKEDNSVTDIQINSVYSNRLKSLISNEIYIELAKEDLYYYYVPFGDFFLNDFTNGFGPRIKFRMQLAHSELLDFKSTFIDSGINNVLHEISVDIKVKGSILTIGYSKSFTVKTSALIAQTVIAGNVPESFTNVDEYPGEDIADEIFNYADKK